MTSLPRQNLRLMSLVEKKEPDPAGIAAIHALGILADPSSCPSSSRLRARSNYLIDSPFLAELRLLP